MIARVIRWSNLRRLLGIAMTTLLVSALAYAQEPSFERARELAFGGEREQARSMCLELLDTNPRDVDTRVLLGRLYAWDKMYDDAREQLKMAVDAHPEYVDARVALIDVELWTDRPDSALWLADRGIEIDPKRAVLHEKRARALKDLGRTKEALDALDAAMETEPYGLPRYAMRGRLLDEIFRNKILLEYEREFFGSDLNDDWQFVTLAYTRQFDRGSVIGRVNWADRFGEDGVQFEIDAYPKLWGKNYLYLNVGVSGDDLFPELRYGAEWFHNHPQGWETSIGFRQLDFDSSDVTIYTGSVAKYVGKHWIAFRPFVTVNGDTSVTYQLTWRRYLGGRYEFFGVTVGFGDDTEDNLITGFEESLNSFRISFDYRDRITDHWVLRGGLGYRDEEFVVTGSRTSTSISVGAERHF